MNPETPEQAYQQFRYQLSVAVPSPSANMNYYRRVNRVRELLHRAVKSQTGTVRILDIGCNECKLWPYFAETIPTAHWIGLDINRNLLRAARPYARHHGMISDDHGGFSVGDIYRLPIKDQSVNIILSRDVFEHLHSWERIFQECNRVLKPGGIMILSVPKCGNPLMDLRNMLRKQKPGEEKHFGFGVDHISIHSRPVIRNYLKKSGFTMIRETRSTILLGGPSFDHSAVRFLALHSVDFLVDTLHRLGMFPGLTCDLSEDYIACVRKS